MNRKGTREQNDISIIRNLPKRLQRRIVEDIGGDVDSLVQADVLDNDATAAPNDVCDGGRPSTSLSAFTGGRMAATTIKDHNECLLSGKTNIKQQQAQDNCRTDVTRIGYFLQKSPLVAASAIGEGGLGKNNHKAEPVLEASGKALNLSNAVIKNNPTIPGILRLSNANQVQMVAGDKNRKTFEKSGGRENATKTKMRFQQFTDNLPTRATDLLTSPVHHHMQPLQLFKTPTWFALLADIQYAEQLPQAYEKVTSLMQQNKVVEFWSDFNETRYELQQIFAKLLLQQLKLCCEQKIDTFFWKLLYYNIREYFKAYNTNKTILDNTQQNRMLVIIDEGLDFYTKLHRQLITKYIDIDQQEHHHKQPLTNNIAQTKIASTPRSTHKFEFIAKVAAQKLLICLGDLCRYKAKELQTNDLSEAAKYYQQAQTLIPTNGIPYNQLAIVAINARKKFDAVYFHMRSLMSSNAIYSARESLLVLFDEIRKKYEETELKTSPIHQCSPRHTNKPRTSKSLRKEVWIHVDGVRRLHRASESEELDRSKTCLIKDEKRFNELESEELLRRFTSLYLYIIGKLYTGIGMETIIEHQRKLLVQLSVLLKRSTFAVKRSRLLRMVALNIFLLEHNMHKESRREIRYYAFNFCNQIFGLLLSKCNTLFSTFAANAFKEQMNHADLNTLLQYINIYANWLIRHLDIWECLRSEDHAIVDTWSEWECLYVWLKHILDKALPATNICEHNMLEEELYLLGFTPLMSSTNSNANANANVNKHDAAVSDSEQFMARICKIATFYDYYEKHKSCLIAREDTFTLEELNGAMEKVLSATVNDEEEEDNSENIAVNGVSVEHNTGEHLDAARKNASHEDAQITQLSKRKKELEAKTNVKKQYNAKLDEILAFVDTKLYIEVRPRYLMPDTNCFIDCLDDFQKLIQDYKRYMLVVPLTVVKELDGLSKGVKVESYQNSMQMHRIHHYDDVSTCAKRSLDFIRTAKNNVKCATTKGSFINASLFALVEEEHVSNDDKILATAVALSKTMSTETNKDGKCLIQTELVLITTDRNLRVKALARNLTVSEMSEFSQWVKDVNTKC